MAAGVVSRTHGNSKAARGKRQVSDRLLSAVLAHDDHWRTPEERCVNREARPRPLALGQRSSLELLFQVPRFADYTFPPITVSLGSRRQGSQEGCHCWGPARWSLPHCPPPMNTHEAARAHHQWEKTPNCFPAVLAPTTLDSDCSRNKVSQLGWTWGELTFRERTPAACLHLGIP